jgi:nucleoside-diphosphate-sugar epimerase/CBS domain-containing protein
MKHELAVVTSGTSIKLTIHAIERSAFDEALIVTHDGLLVGVVRSTDLRRLLISGVDEADAVGAYPPKYALRLSDQDMRNERRVEPVLNDMRLRGASHVPVVTASGAIQDVLSVADLEARLGKLGPAPADVGSAKTILVVGGAGYLGGILTRKLLAKGYRVRVLDSFIYGGRAMEEIAPHDRLEVVEGDMRNIHTCVAALEGVHGVVLLAAIVGDPSTAVRPAETIETNVLATQALASACKLQNIARFLYASTCSVYGVGADVLDEESPVNPVSLYARTKIASEKIVLELGDDFFCPTVLRMGTLYGYSPRMRFDLVVNTMTMKSFTDNRIQVFGGRQWRPLLNVEDAADVYVACLEADLKDVGNQVFNVGSDAQNYQIDEIAGIVSGCLGEVRIERDESSLDARDYRVSFAKLEAAVGFAPRHSVAGSAREIYEKLASGIIRDPAQKIYYNHYFDASEE